MVSEAVTTTINKQICAGQLPYQWNNQSITSAGRYTATLATSAGCDSIVTLNLSVSESVSYTMSRRVCIGELPITWNGQSINAAGTYTTTLRSAGGCDSLVTLVLSVGQPVNITENRTVCKTSLPIIWHSQSLTTEGTYQAKLASTTGCDSIATLVLTIEEPVAGQQLPNVTVAPYTNTRLNGRNLGADYTYQWTPATGLNMTSVYDPVFNYNQSVQYMVSMTSASGCVTIDTLQVNVQSTVINPADATTLVPTAWSPNSDGKNDLLYPNTKNMRELKYFRVYNKYGQLMFSTNQLNKGWDGRVNGKLQDAYIYTWILEMVGLDGKTYKMSGNSLMIL